MTNAEKKELVRILNNEKRRALEKVAGKLITRMSALEYHLWTHESLELISTARGKRFLRLYEVRNNVRRKADTYRDVVRIIEEEIKKNYL